MRSSPHTSVAALAVLAALALTGCTTPAAPVVPPESPSATPVFASDEEALAAAKDAYAKYQSAVDHALQVVDVAGLDVVASGDALKSAKDSVSDFKKKGQHQTGVSTIDTVAAADLSALTESPPTGDPAQIYACLDVSGVDVIDSTGQSVSVPGRVTRFPLFVSLVSSKKGALLVAEESVWDGTNFC